MSTLAFQGMWGVLQDYSQGTVVMLKFYYRTMTIISSEGGAEDRVIVQKE